MERKNGVPGEAISDPKNDLTRGDDVWVYSCSREAYFRGKVLGVVNPPENDANEAILIEYYVSVHYEHGVKAIPSAGLISHPNDLRRYTPDLGKQKRKSILKETTRYVRSAS